jgi:LCP family protein required for cell wall assembly
VSLIQKILMINPGNFRHLRNASILLGLALLCLSTPLIYSTLDNNPSPTPRAQIQGENEVVLLITPTYTPLISDQEGVSLTPTIGDIKSIGTPVPTNVTQTPEIVPTETETQVRYNISGTPLPVTWGNYPGPKTWPSTAIPPPVEQIVKPEDQINIVLLGDDRRPRVGTRTDVVMLLTLNPEEGNACVTSFPRDLFVYAPGYTMMRINSTRPHGGFDLVALTFEYNFGIRPDHYVNINIRSFIEVIDILGGIDVVVPQPLSDPVFANGTYSVPAGLVHMDGPTAAWYSRSRSTTSDFNRNQRQQEVLRAIFKRLISLEGIARAPEIYNLFIDNVETDLTLENLLPLLPLAVKLIDPSNICQRAIGRGQVIDWRTPSGGAVLLPKRQEVYNLLVEVIKP